MNEQTGTDTEICVYSYHLYIFFITEKLVGEAYGNQEGTDNGAGLTTKESLRSRQKKLYDRTRIVQAALPRLFMQLNIESDGIDVEGKTKIVSYEEASKQINQDPSRITLLSEIISQCRDDNEKAANGGRVESDGRVENDGETKNEKCGMISLEKWKKAVRKSKAVGCVSVDGQTEGLS